MKEIHVRVGIYNPRSSSPIVFSELLESDLLHPSQSTLPRCYSSSKEESVLHILLRAPPFSHLGFDSAPVKEPAKMRLTAELIQNSLSYLNPLKERELDLRGAYKLKRADTTL